MTSLRAALEMTPWRQLRAIGRRRGLRLSSNLRKADLVELLTQALSHPANLEAALATLSQAQQDALADILAAGGRLPLCYLRPRHGDLTAAPLERLQALGLIFHDRAADDLFVPHDLVPHLPAPAHPSSPIPAPGKGDLESALVAAHDLACLLALLQREKVRPLHGRWLPPRLLAVWGARCALPPLRLHLTLDHRRLTLDV
ncbi:MAG: hypothetical protein Kow0063_41080 [Anaerolineae bacterium]